MEEEIKEIIEHIKTYPEKMYCLSEKEKTKLLDYITHLQEENERLKEELQQEKKDFKETNDYCFELKDYKSRCEKAIEYILNNKLYEDALHNYVYEYAKKNNLLVCAGSDYHNKEDNLNVEYLTEEMENDIIKWINEVPGKIEI